MIEIISEHSIRTDLLRSDAVILDAGCRAFTFSNEMARRGYNVIAMDADPTVKPPSVDGVRYLSGALTSKAGVVMFKGSHDPQAGRIDPSGDQTVMSYTIKGVMDAFSVKHFGAVKLDIEGSEYEVLRNWPGPISNMISCEFHEHVCPQPASVYDAIFEHLGKWYDCVSHEKTARHCLPPNWWDTLWVAKGCA